MLVIRVVLYAQYSVVGRVERKRNPTRPTLVGFRLRSTRPTI